MKTIASLAFLSSAATVAGHATFQQLWVNGEDMESSCIRMPKNNSPVTDVSSNDIRCNAAPSAAAGICEAKAGDKVSVEMHAQPNDRSCASDAIGGNHFGPVMVYMSKVADAEMADGSDPFFKIAESGYDADTDTWGTDILNENCGKFDVTLPADLEAGDYLLRAEAIALHAASQVNGAQFYVSCYQLRVAGGGSSIPQGVELPGAYSATDPGIKVDIWGSGFDHYDIPGPVVLS